MTPEDIASAIADLCPNSKAAAQAMMAIAAWDVLGIRGTEESE